MRFGKILMVGVAASILFGSPVYAAGKKAKAEWTSTWTYNKSSKTWKKKAVKVKTSGSDLYEKMRKKYGSYRIGERP